jgi:RecJ-like exonuclease
MTTPAGDEERRSGEELEPGDEAPPEEPSAGENVCPACDGSGKADGETCENCGGSGKVIEAIGGG